MTVTELQAVMDDPALVAGKGVADGVGRPENQDLWSSAPLFVESGRYCDGYRTHCIQSAGIRYE